MTSPPVAFRMLGRGFSGGICSDPFVVTGRTQTGKAGGETIHRITFVFILTHHARAAIEMEGGTTFHFISGGIREALDRAREAAAGMDVRIGGGPNTIQQFLREGLIDELHIAIAPVLLGRGELLFKGIDLRAMGYKCDEFVASAKATHVVLRRQEHMGA